MQNKTQEYVHSDIVTYADTVA